MALKAYQEQLQLGELYEISVRGGVKGSEQINANIWVNSGTVDIYASNSATAPTTVTDMTLDEVDTGVGGTLTILTAPRYIAIVQNGGTSTEINASGLNITSLGAIS